MDEDEDIAGERPAEGSGKALARDARAQRLAARLKANLRRRKEQARGRGGADRPARRDAD